MINGWNRELKRNDLAGVVLRVGYCRAYYLTQRLSRVMGYNRGVYGWNWTAYDVMDDKGRTVTICTGYRNLTGQTFDGLEAFEKKAEALDTWDAGEKRKLANDFVDAVFKQLEGGEN